MGTEGFVSALETVGALVPAMVSYVDASLVFRYVSPSICERLGRTREQLIGASMRAVFGDRDFAAREEDLAAALAGTTIRREHEAPALDRSTFVRTTYVPHKDSAGITHGLLIMTEDVSALRTTEAALREANEELQRAQAMAGIATWVVMGDNREMRASNEMLRMFGIDPAEFTHSAEIFEHRLHPDDSARVTEYFLAAQEQPTTTDRGVETRIIRPDGELRWVEIHAQVERDAQGKIVRTVGTTLDITRRKNAEAALRASEEQFRQAQKMESIGQLAGGVAHDFNNILSVVMSFSELTARALPADHPTQENLQEIIRATQRAAELTRQMLAFSRKQVLTPRVIDVNTVLSDLESMLGRLIGEHVELVLHLAPRVRKVYADANQLQQVVMNLALNARDAMPDGGKLTIETADTNLDAGYARTHFEASAGAHVRIAVSDTGTGMDAETRERIFEPFFTTKMPGRGTGLGLSTVFGIVKQSGGNIWVYSEPGKGTTFEIYLPVTERPSEASAAIAAARALRGSETILLVEDEEQLRRVVEKMLTHCGFRVISAPDPLAAIELARNEKDRIHLLLTDIVMPRMNGKELADAVTKVRPDIRVLYMSGYTENTIVHDGVLDEGVAFLPKPLTTASLLAAVRSALDR